MYLPSSFDGKYWMPSFCVVLCQCVMSSQLPIEIIGITMTNLWAKIQISSVCMCTRTYTHTHTQYQDVETVTVVTFPADVINTSLFVFPEQFEWPQEHNWLCWLKSYSCRKWCIWSFVTNAILSHSCSSDNEWKVMLYSS